jgi:hypothetical protein
MILGALVAELTGAEAPVRADQAFSAVAGELPAFQGITYRDIGTRGALVNEPAGVAGD